MSIKVIHTSDWHLGKKLFKEDRIEEQRLFLNWLHHYLVEESIDALIVAGDIFDSPIPPTNALKLYFNFLYKLTNESDCKVFIISGNHDSGRFLNAPIEFFAEKNIHIFGEMDIDQLRSVELQKDEEKVNLIPLPFFRLHELSQFKEKFTEDSKDFDADSLMNLLKDYTSSLVKEDAHNILCAHHLFGHFELSGSEQVLSSIGLDTISPKIFENIDYMALGHLHGRQKVSSEKPLAIYPGSPIAFRFNEAKQKYISSLTFSNGEMNQEYVEVPSFS